MHPNTFLRTFWQLELRPQIFVAMSFSKKYESRFEDIIRPAIRGIQWNDLTFEAVRVDLLKTGDSILTDIADGIAHSQLVLADVSSIYKDTSGHTYRNGNVMYEVGIALTCRQPTEVLLVRDDDDKFLFDVSTIPHMKIDFRDKDKAIELLRSELLSRLREQQLLYDARVQMTLATLNQGEIQILRNAQHIARDQCFSPTNQGGIVVNGIDVNRLSYITRLLDKQLVIGAGVQPNGTPLYKLTSFGYIVMQEINRILPP